MKKTRKNLLTKFRDFWRSLTPLERGRLWDIMTALRGEDYYPKALRVDMKKLTTARIRGELLGDKLSSEIREAGNVIVCTKASEIHPSVYADFRSTHSHFYYHIIKAICALKPYIKKKKISDLLKFIQ